MADEPGGREAGVIGRDEDRHAKLFGRQVRPAEHLVSGVGLKQALVGRQSGACEHLCSAQAQSAVALVLIRSALQFERSADGLDFQLQVDRPARTICLVDVQCDGFFRHDLSAIQLPNVFGAECGYTVFHIVLQPADEMLP